ncbi:MAG: TlpA family protein disulfide reductase, partial [Bacteroidaceae bacterium]|nr:TlpA family protein disulfide reductase [Bacteroidaceae bacterium]
NVCHFSQPAYTSIMPLFIGPRIYTDGFSDQYNMIVIPGETLTVDFDPATCLARIFDFKAGKPSHKGYRLGGTIGDLNEVLLDNKQHFSLYLMSEIPTYDEVKDFPEWREKLWQNLDTLRKSVMKRKDYTRRQKDFFTLLIDRAYVRCNVLCLDFIEYINRDTLPDAALAHLKNTYTLVDPHAKELQYFQDGRSYYFPLKDEVLPYFEANGLTESEPYKMTKALVEAKKIGDVMKLGKILPESEIEKAHPYFQRALREFNDSNRIQLERIEREANERMKPTPNVPGDKLLQHIVNEHPGKAVFFDLWATWCGPCKRGIEAMEPLKEKLKGKDIVFVYLTDESSFMNEWTESVLKIPGIHYRIPSKKWEEMNIPGGIPQYYLYDRKGKKVWEETGFNDEVLKDIEAQIAKVLE